jgi:fructokinase
VPDQFPTAKATVVVCGEALIDELQQEDGSVRVVPGGSPRNTATALTRLGIATSLIAQIGRDEYGDLLLADLAQSGVDTSLVGRPPVKTTVAHGTPSSLGGTRYRFSTRGRADSKWSKKALPDFGSATFCVVAGSLASAITSMAQTFHYLFKREAGHRIIVFDPNVRPDLIGTDQNRQIAARTRFDAWITNSTIVKMSAEDAKWLYPGRSYAQVARAILQRGPALVVITNGGRHARAATCRWQITLKPPRRRQKGDTVGAGDTLTAGLVYWMHEHGVSSRAQIEAISEQDLNDALRTANAVAVMTCENFGAVPPTLSEVLARGLPT